MAQDWTVREWKAWTEEVDGIQAPIKDSFGNFKGSVTFDEYKAEPVDATFKTQPKIGDKKFGDIVPYTTKSGKERTKFQRADRPMEQGSFAPKGSPDRNDEIRAQFAIKAAVAWGRGDKDEANIERDAKFLYALVDRVKNSEQPTKTTSTVTVTVPANSVEATAVPMYEPTPEEVAAVEENLDIPF